MAKTTMIIDGEVVSGFAKNLPRVQELITGLKARIQEA